MGRIDNKFKALRSAGRKAFMPYITAGDPSLPTTESLIRTFSEAGSSVIELGVPFSDPIADGPVNQRSAIRALKNDVSLRRILQMVGSLRSQGEEIPIVLFTYYNPIYKFGLAKLASAAAESGVDGLVVPDLPPDEADGLREEAKRCGLDTIFLLAPTSTVERIKLVATSSTGFIYYVSRTGVTGERERLSSTIERSVVAIRSYTDTPIAVGFGVSKADQVREIARIADGVIVGSAIVRAIEENIDRPDLVSAVGELVSGFVQAMGPSEA